MGDFTSWLAALLALHCDQPPKLTNRKKKEIYNGTNVLDYCSKTFLRKATAATSSYDQANQQKVCVHFIVVHFKLKNNYCYKRKHLRAHIVKRAHSDFSYVFASWL